MLGLGGWQVFPHAHSTSRLHHFTWVGILRLPHSFHRFGPSSRGGMVHSSFFTHRILPGFSSRSKLEGRPQDTISMCIDVFLTDWVDGVGCMLPYRFRTVYFPVTSLLRPGLWFSPRRSFAVGATTFWGCC